jgi:outer membrane protein
MRKYYLKRYTAFIAALLLVVSNSAGAQVSSAPGRHWSFLTRIVATGSSDRSEPTGYKVYSAFALDAAIRHSYSRLLGVELSLRTESREVDSLVPAGEDRRLGSLELLPINLLLQVRPFGQGGVHPYAGAGLNLTVAWEKSGTLDSVDMKGSVGPAVQAGVDIDLGPRALLNVDLQWNTLNAKLENGGTRLTDLKIDPLRLGVGIGFLF